ncbi:MAG: DUF3006 domain-containing protein [Clostridia bacterium]|nr:DUF3006 domain-containing protein [Clostridia bacterium]
MKKLKLTKLELGMAICEDKEKKIYGIQINELPDGVRLGQYIIIDDEGNISIEK